MKSRGIGVFGDSAQETGVPPDVWRFYLLSHRPETNDAEFTDNNNNVLLNDLGNFVNRIFKFVNSRHYSGVAPDWTRYNKPSFESWKENIRRSLTQYLNDLDSVKLRAGIHTVLEISQKGNAFLQSQKVDNSLADTEPTRCAAVVRLDLIAAILRPFIPDTADSIDTQLRATSLPIPDGWIADCIQPGHETGPAKYLFSCTKLEKAEECRQRLGSDQRE